MLSGHYNGVLFSPLGLELAQFPVKAQHISVRLSIFLSLLQRVEVGSGQELFYTAMSRRVQKECAPCGSSAKTVKSTCFGLIFI